MVQHLTQQVLTCTVSLMYSTVVPVFPSKLLGPQFLYPLQTHWDPSSIIFSNSPVPSFIQIYRDSGSHCLQTHWDSSIYTSVTLKGAMDPVFVWLLAAPNSHAYFKLIRAQLVPLLLTCMDIFFTPLCNMEKWIKLNWSINWNNLSPAS